MSDEPPYRIATEEPDERGIPWQIVPEGSATSLADPDPSVSGSIFAAMQNMVKLDIATLQRAAVG